LYDIWYSFILSLEYIWNIVERLGKNFYPMIVQCLTFKMSLHEKAGHPKGPTGEKGEH
jgi:hypothetical protein